MTVRDRRRGRGDVRRRDDAGFSMVVTGAAMVVSALLVLVAVGATLGTSSPPSSSGAGNPEVSAADRLQAQQSLTTALQAVSAAAAGGAPTGIPGIASSGTASGVSVASLAAADPSVTFVPGPSSSPTTVSVTTDQADPGSVTLATHSSDGVCWLVWHAPGAVTWFGAQTHASSCTAPALASPPTAGPVSSSAIGWQTSSFPPV